MNRTVNLQYQGLGAYAEGAYNFNQNLRLIGGVRLDTNTRFSDVPISPRAALIVNGFGGRLTLKYVFSMAYVAPSPYYSYNIFDNGVQIGTLNTRLSPERARSNEASVTWRTEYLLLSGSAYYNQQSDLLITSQSEAPETVISPMVFVNPDGTGMRRLANSVNLGTSTGLGYDLFFRFSTQGSVGLGLLLLRRLQADAGSGGVGAAPDLPAQRPGRGHPGSLRQVLHHPQPGAALPRRRISARPTAIPG